MKKKLLISVISLAVIFSACTYSDDNSSQIVDTTPQTASSEIQESSIESSSYEDMLLDAVGEDYFNARAIIRSTDEDILGDTCAVFLVGTNSEDKFTTEERLAVTETGTVYWHDIVSDTWLDYTKKDTVTQATDIDYSPYSSLIYAYQKALNQTPTTSGRLYANLVDFNGDDICELVIARVYHNEMSYFDTQNISYAKDYEKPMVHIYALDENGGVKHEGEFSFVQTNSINNDFSILYLIQDGLTYLITDVTDDVLQSREGTQYFWQYNPEDEHTAFSLNETVDINSDTLPTEFQNHVILSINSEIMTEDITGKTVQFLDAYPKSNSVGTSAVFNNGSFFILEDTPKTPEEQAVFDYEKAIVLEDYSKITELRDDQDFVNDMKSTRDDGLFIPGKIIENVELLQLEELPKKSIVFEQQLYQSVEVSTLTKPTVVVTDTQPVLDADVSPYQGQYGAQENQNCYVFDNINNEISLIETFSDSYMVESHNAFAVSFVGYYQDVIDAYGYEIPVFDLILTETEQDSIEYFSTEYGNEYYLIQSLWGSPIEVYESYIDDNGKETRGTLLYKTEGDVLYLLCNVSDLYSNVEIVTSHYEGGMYNYHPFISLFDGELQHGDYTEDFNLLP